LPTTVVHGWCDARITTELELDEFDGGGFDELLLKIRRLNSFSDARRRARNEDE
jgi:hypothetical protein